MQNQNETDGIARTINDFIQKHRKPILISAGAVILLLILSAAAFSLIDVFRGRAISAVEDLSNRYETLRYAINEEYMERDIAELLADTESFAKKNSSYAGGKAWSIIGSIYSEKKDWEKAEDAWVSAAGKSEKNYLAPIAWFNAGIAAEQQEKPQQAIDHYAKSLSATAGFAAAPRAQFAIGRLRETLNEKDAAIAAYRAVIAGWPYDSAWTNLARSRIIMLELQ